MDRGTTRRRRVVAGLALVAVAVAASVGADSAVAATRVKGIDVSNYQGDVDWSKVKASGRRFAFVLATDGTSFTSPTFPSQYRGARRAGLYHGAYHFARPGSGTARGQARRFIGVVGKSITRRTLAPVLDMEVNPNGSSCYGLTAEQMISWMRKFFAEVRRLTGRKGIIYTGPGFWRSCTGNTRALRTYPLWTAEYGVSRPQSFGGWETWTFWQTSSTASVPGVNGDVDSNVFNGGIERLRALAGPD